MIPQFSNVISMLFLWRGAYRVGGQHATAPRRGLLTAWQWLDGFPARWARELGVRQVGSVSVY